ncbi:unnamed protein product (macronuclear) [Paramecium tetraurelia]|uniref:Transmembrane protein n=1 Tax=Paramecium tetraurelia TaxID=5888 RepID=A0DET9_PARTE|nr:uncharacterized protein GSPATT00016382001 [Paramecium tetraurelia]CAK81556.1 unnamed protein product [Paramecium tetraurelia]|eukprot:XP_001448953.1 hypothetical protein (macronuclear) [Paramecium tetraurelia strain d4-2]
MNFAERRNKTNPDQNQLLSMSNQSSQRNSAVKATLKVYSEMKEDQSCKLALRFTQLKIVLATHKIVGICHKIKAIRLQHYFDVLLLTKTPNANPIPMPILNKNQQGQIQYLTPPTKKKSVKFQPKFSIAPCLLIKSMYNKRVRSYFNILQYNQNKKNKQISFNSILMRLFRKKQTQHFQILKTRLLQSKIFRKIALITKQKIKSMQLEALLTISQYIYNANIHSQQVSLLDSEFSQQQQLEQQTLQDLQEHEINNQLMSAKEQLAMKFASTSLLIGILSQVMIKAQFAFLFHLSSGCNQKLDIREIKSIDISENLDQSQIEEDKIKPKIIAANQINHFLIQKLKQYFYQINQVPSKISRPSIKYYRGDKKLRSQNSNHKLLILGQKIFKEDDPQQKSTDITVNEKKGSFKALPGVRYVTQYSDISKNAISDSEVTEQSIITNSVNTLQTIKTSVLVKNQSNHQTFQNKPGEKKETLNSAIHDSSQMLKKFPSKNIQKNN